MARGRRRQAWYVMPDDGAGDIDEDINEIARDKENIKEIFRIATQGPDIKYQDISYYKY